MSHEPRFSHESIAISKAAEASRRMTHLQRLEVMVKTGLVSREKADELKANHGAKE
jgi:multidrug resistance efflux pump